MLKLFVSDIDGTLMNAQKKILDEDIQKLQIANDSGVTICLASGRMYEEIKQVIDILNFPCYAICQNGASIFDEKGTVLRSNCFETELALSIYDFVQQSGLVPVICRADGNFVTHMTDEAERVGRRFLTPLCEKSDLPQAIHKGMEITKFSIYGPVPLLEVLLNQLKFEYFDQLTASFSDPDGIDIMPANVDKGAGIQLVEQYLGINQENVASIGDSYNDLAMFRRTAFSFAMTHAPEPVKEEAVFVANTVGEALHKLLDQ